LDLVSEIADMAIGMLLVTSLVIIGKSVTLAVILGVGTGTPQETSSKVPADATLGFSSFLELSQAIVSELNATSDGVVI
jgi:hypothetical protein